MKFLDEVIIFVASGSGGPGSVHFRREKYVPKGGPDGGDGGTGGSIHIQASHNKYSLLDYHYKRKYKASNGNPGGGQNCTGANAEDITLTVPLGTVIYEYNPEIKHKKRALADLNTPEQITTIVKGGRGGKGNWFFRSATYQAPKFAQPGEPGEEKWLFLEVQLLSDVGFVGFPNAGKSTLLRAISNARPKVADYPFTTLEPHLGIARMFNKDLVLGDLPGLIEGASQGVGLGLKFLKHIQRNRCLLFILNGDPMFDKSPSQQYQALTQEIRNYNAELLNKRGFIALNKIDLMDTTQLQEHIKSFEEMGLTSDSIFPISAVTKSGVDNLLRALFKTVHSGLEENIVHMHKL